MGAPLSKPSCQPDAPSAPYAQGKSRRRFLVVSRKRSEPRILTQLILRQDWQKVLVRAKLFPHEISQTVTLELYDLPLQLLPLHLACALDPPVAVVTLFLKLNAAAATSPVVSIDQQPQHKSTRSFRRPFRTLRQYSRLVSSRSVASASSIALPGLFRDSSRRSMSQAEVASVPEQFPGSQQGISFANQSLLDRRQTPSKGLGKRAMSLVWRPYRQLDASVGAGADSSSMLREGDFDQQGEQSETPASFMENSLSSSSIASSSRQSSSIYMWHGGDSSVSLLEHNPPKGVILQLSPSGGISPFPIGSQETDSTSETLSQGGTIKNLFGVQWDLTPLWESMANGTASPDNSLLAIHVATLYQASPAVLKQLLEVHPMGAVSSVLGMLPIHMASAGWVLEPWVPPPPPPPTASKPGSQSQPALQPYHHHHERHPSRLKEILSVLNQVVPESVRIRSGNHGMTPREYIAEAMEDCIQKEECLALLEPGESGEDGTVEVKPTGPLEQLSELASTHPSLLFVDSFDASREIPWEIQCASSSSSSLLVEAPKKSVSISSLLISQDWEGALSLAEDDPQHAQEWFYGVDDHLDPTIDVLNNEGGSGKEDKLCIVWKRLALHLACRYRAPVGLVDVLVEAYPQAVTSADPNCGSLPIHLACQHKSSYRVVKSLLMHAPTTSKAVDKRGRLPLHHAVIAKAHYAIIELLLEVDSSAALAADGDNQTPLALAKETYGKKNVIVRLLEMVTLVLEKPALTQPVGRKRRKEKFRGTACYI